MFAAPLLSDARLRQQIRSLAGTDETACVAALLERGGVEPRRRQRVEEQAASLVQAIRQRQHFGAGINSLLNEYSLSSHEGVLLMCLAEALLRVPDALTADRLISDKLGGGDWSAHLGHGGSLFVNASAWGLLLTGKFVEFSQAGAQSPLQRLRQVVGRGGEPAIRAAMRLAVRIMGTQFVLGKDIDEALDRSGTWGARGYRFTYDMLGEAARTGQYAADYFASYCAAIEQVGRAADSASPLSGPGFSIKLSALQPRCELAQVGRWQRELVPRVLALATLARDYNLGLTIDAEEFHRLDLTLDIVEQVFMEPALRGWEGFGLAVQTYLKSAPAVIEWLHELALRRHRKIMVRLVKGAYWDAEIKLAQTLGYACYPVYTRKASSDLAYLVGARRLLQCREAIYPQFATHNAHAVAAIVELAGDSPGYEFQRLHGMGEELYDELSTQRGEPVPCRIYAPVGEHRDLLAYLVRRLLENGANSSFVHQLADGGLSDQQLAEDPARRLLACERLANPAIPLPGDIYGGGRIGAAGVNLDDVNTLQRVAADLEPWRRQIAAVGCAGDLSDALPVCDPVNPGRVLGYYQASGGSDLEQRLQRACEAFPAWSGRSEQQRAVIIRRAADLLERHCHELAGFCIREAGKTLRDAIADVREAVDFCRYYADQASELWRRDAPAARGVLLCISPWNFPVAIFTGQVCAALVVGNTVLAKPAEQTTLTALRVVQLLHEAGVPDEALQVAAGPGEPIGRELLPDERIAGVLFTGSSEVARYIARTLAARDGERVPLIAETGGQNTMVVDSTALLEKVVDDVIASGFNSAGQRCSALRVLLVQEEVAEPLIDMLVGAMQQLRMGDPADPATDIGPLIDRDALARLRGHLDYITTGRGHLLYQCELPTDIATGDGHFFAPALVELDSIAALPHEVFGPVVHLIRYRAEQVSALPAMINSTGYGLTCGVHSRIEPTIDLIARQVDAGNIYVNRNMIGAVVGVQPFGGRGLSGTGPKAGGPLYLQRLVKRAAQQGNAAEPVTLVPPTGVAVQATAPSWRDAIAALNAACGRWRDSQMAQRIACITRLASLVGAQVAQKGGDGQQVLAELDSLIAQGRRAARPLELRGPTGESNTLYLEARGVIVCLLRSGAATLEALVPATAAILAGNAVLIAAPDAAAAAGSVRSWLLEAGFPGEVVAAPHLQDNEQLHRLIRDAAIAAVATGAGGDLARLASRALAQRDGAILPLLDDAFGPAYLARFCYEKTITVNTAATGGNAALMSQAEPD